MGIALPLDVVREVLDRLFEMRPTHRVLLARMCRWARERYGGGRRRDPIGFWSRAATDGEISLLGWAWDEWLPRDEGACWEGAAASGCIESLEWMLSRGFSWDVESVPCRCRRERSRRAAVAEGERLSVGHGLPVGGVPPREPRRAAMDDDATAPVPRSRGALAHRHTRGGGRGALGDRDGRSTLLRDSTCFWAAFAGQQGVLHWARRCDPPCSWDQRVCGVALERGHHAVFRWLIDEGCPCDEGVLALAWKQGVMGRL